MSWGTFWDDRYGEEGWAYGTEPNDFLKEQVFELFGGEGCGKGKKALTLAEGEGRNAIFLAEQGFEVHAVDLSSVGLDKLQGLARSKGLNVSTEVADLSTYDLGKHGPWDLVVSIWFPTPPDLRRKIHAGVLVNLSDKGGTYLVESYSPDNVGRMTGGPPTDMCMTLGELLKELKGLDCKVGQETERFVAEGKYHTAQQKSAVVQYVGVKP